MSDWLSLDSGIRYLKSTADPLSADIGLIRGKDHLWLFDVGAGAQALERLQALPQKPCVVLSHFHPDHMGNLDKLDWEALYLGHYTFLKTGFGTVVRKPLTISDGIQLTIFPIPSSHAKGSLGLEVNEAYAFLGDAVYSSAKQGRTVYNATLLKDTIASLRTLRAPYFLLSHAEPFVQKKEEVLAMLEGIYAQRKPACPDIFPR